MTVVFSDNFNRADSTDFGSDWEKLSGGNDYGIVSNQAKLTNGVSGILRRTTNIADNYAVDALVSLGNAVVDHNGYVFARITAANNFYRFGLEGGLQPVVKLRRQVNGSWTTLGSVNVNASAETFYRTVLSVEGSSLKGYWDNEWTPSISVTDTAHATGDPGVGGYGADVGGDTAYQDTYQEHDTYDPVPWIVSPTMVYDTPEYVFYGVQVPVSADELHYYARSSAIDDAQGGYIIWHKYIASTDTWTGPFTLYTDPTYDCRNVGGGKIGNDIFIFFTRYDPPDTFVDVKMLRYRADTQQWDSPVTMPTTGYEHFSAYGPLTQRGSDYHQTFWCDDVQANEYYSRTWVTHDDGDTWGLGDTIATGVWTSYTETCIVELPDGNAIAYVRDDRGTNVLQCTRVSGVWGSVVNTNLGETSGSKVVWAIYDEANAKIIMVFADRANFNLYLASGLVSEVFTDPTQYDLQALLVDSAGPLDAAYPGAIFFDNGRLYLNWCQEEIIYTDADLWYAILEIIPTAPSNLTGAINGQNVQLNWQDNSSSETGFKISRKAYPGGSWGQIGTTSAGITTYTDVDAPIPCYYRVQAYAAEDSLYSNVIIVGVSSSGLSLLGVG